MPNEIIRIEPQALIAQAIEKGLDVEQMQQLFQLAKDVRAEQAREAWNRAMAQFQAECPVIIKTEKAKIGNHYEYHYAALDGIIGVVKPLMGKLGLSISWRVRHEEGRVLASCRISHEAGHHEESGDVSMPIDTSSGMGASAPQRVGIASTYAKRYALLAILGIAPEDDPDGDDKAKPPMQRPQAKPQTTAPAPTPPDKTTPAKVSEPQRRMMFARLKAAGKTADELAAHIEQTYGLAHTGDLTPEQFEKVLAWIGDNPPC